jgi:hypothetical protein
MTTRLHSNFCTICHQQPRVVCVMLMTMVFAFTIDVHAIPPLTQAQQERLVSAYDGRDHREEAFIALLEHVQQWTAIPGDAAVRLHPDLDRMTNDPEMFRGELVYLTGRIQQQHALDQPYGSAHEWFLRDENGRPFIVFVVDLSEQSMWRDGDSIGIFARFYKRIDATDRQGQEQQYAAFVGTQPHHIDKPHASTPVQLWIVALPIVILFVAFALLLVFVRRQRSRPRPPRRIVVDDCSLRDSLDETADLPDDPAQALAELKRRADRSPDD